MISRAVRRVVQRFLKDAAVSMPSQSNALPAKLHSTVLGPLRLEEIRLDGRIFQRHYETTVPIRVTCSRVGVADDGINIVVWFTDEVISDATQFVARIEARWNLLVGQIDAILGRSEEFIADALTEWGDPDSEVVSVETFLASAKLQQVNVNLMDDDTPHVLIIHDAGEFVGCHDLNLELDGELTPVTAHFDG